MTELTNVVREVPASTFGIIEPASAAPHVVKKIKREFLPDSQVDYSFDLNDLIEIKVESSTSTMAAGEVYFRCLFQAIGIYDNTAAVVPTNLSKVIGLSGSGIASCFRRIEVVDDSGTVLDEVEEYDRLHDILDHIFHSRNHANPSEYTSGTSQEPLGEALRSGVTLAAQVLADGSTFDAIDASGMGFYYRGQQIEFYDANGILLHKATVVSLSGTTVTFTPKTEVVLGVGTIVFGRYPASIASIPVNSTDLPAANYIELNMRINMGFFKLPVDFPLNKTKGFRLRMFLQDPKKALTWTRGGFNEELTTKELKYNISKPRLIVHLRQPSAGASMLYDRERAAGNLKYVFPAYQFRQKFDQGNEGLLDFDIQVSRSSLSKVIWVIQNSKAQAPVQSATAQNDGFIYDSKTYIDGLLKNYQFEVGSEDYPNRRVEIRDGDPFMSDAFTETELAFGLHDNISTEMKVPWHKFAKFNLNDDSPPEWDQSHKAIFATSFQAIVNDTMTGIRTRSDNATNHVRAKFEVGSYTPSSGINTRYWSFWFQFPRIVQITPDGELTRID